MGFLSSIFSASRTTPNPPAVPSRSARLQVLSQAVAATLRRHGIPSAWVTAETLPARISAEQRGLHLRLVIRTTTPKLLTHVHALERAVRAQLLQLDPEAGNWLAGTSWRVDIPAGSDNTELPGPEFWQPHRRAKPSQPSVPAVASARELVTIRMNAGDEAFARTSWGAPDFGPTQPMTHH